MSVEQSPSRERAPRPRPTRAQRITAWAFLGAFGLTILTVLLTGLYVRAPRSNAYDPRAPAASAPGKSDSTDATDGPAERGEPPAH